MPGYYTRQPLCCQIHLSPKVVAQLATSQRMPELAKRLGLDLADALSGYTKSLPHLFQGVALSVL